MHTRRRLRSRLQIFAALAALVLAPPLGAAVPGQVDFQGLLLDSAGEKVNGAVDLTFRLYDAPSGGSLLWTESHNDVQVADGVYGVTLGAVTPLTQNELGGGTVYLEIQVESETLTPRRQLLAVPYAIRAESADNVGGTPAAFVEQLYQHADFDGNGITNDDPVEGVADADGDGAANFIDADNDDDTISDPQEVANGSDPNLITPVVTNVAPNTIGETGSVLVTVTGVHFDQPGFAVSVGGQSPTPSSVTATSFQILVQPEPHSSSAVVVSIANGESGQKPFFFQRELTKFVTSTGYSGDLGGIAGADAKCQERASAAGLPGTYLALITDGVLVPASRAIPLEEARFEDTLGNPLGGFEFGTGLDEFGNQVVIFSNSPRAWYGTLGNPALDCVDWTSSSASDVGQSRGIPPGTQSLTDICSISAFRLYCFEQ